MPRRQPRISLNQSNIRSFQATSKCSVNSQLLRTSYNYWHGHGDYWSTEHTTGAGWSQKLDRPPSIVTFTTNFIWLKSHIKYHVKGEYEYRNTWSGTSIITKDMEDYSVVKSYLENNILHNFTFSPNFKEPWGLMLQRYQREPNDGHSNGTERAKSCETTPSVPCYLNKKNSVSSDIEAEQP
jgi:hypothetical protein